METKILIVVLAFLEFYGDATAFHGSIPIGGSCLAHVDCVGIPQTSSECDSLALKCVCLDGYVVKRDLLDCLPKRNDVGEDCIESSQCQQGDLERLSNCTGTPSTCQCNDNALQLPGLNTKKCFLKATTVGEPCEGEDEQCKANLGEDAICDSNKKCICNHLTSVPSEDNKLCLKVANEIGGECTLDSQCHMGIPGPLSDCIDGKCQCQDNTVSAENICLGKSKLWEPCQHDVQCKSTVGHFGACNKDLMVCLCDVSISIPNASDTLCLPIVHGLGKECKESPQCQKGTPGEWSECTENECKCKSDAVNQPGHNVCYPSKNLLGDQCAIHQQCQQNLGDTSECFEDKCRCKPGHVPSNDRTKCYVGDISIGEPCQQSNQCPSNSVCSDTGYCTCNPRHVPSLDRKECLPVVDQLDGNCKESPQCQQGIPGEWSHCFSGVCKCQSEAVDAPPVQKCYKKAEFVGDKCEVMEQCITSLEYSHCNTNSGICECFANAAPSSDKTKCLLKVDLGDTCIDSGQCQHITHCADCLADDSTGDKICACCEGHASPPKNDICLKEATRIGDSCEDHDIQCDGLTGAVCVVNGTKSCHCNYDKEIVSRDRKKCLEIRDNLLDSCEETEQCNIANSECLNSECVCRPDEYVASSRSTCLQVVKNLHEECSESVQCTAGIDEFTQCSQQGHCQCKPRYYEYLDGHCYSPSLLDGHCDSDAECIVGVNNLTECRKPDSKCHCVPYAVPTLDKSRCVVKVDLGGKCELDEQCQAIPELATCQLKDAQRPEEGSICKCANGFASPPNNDQVCYELASKIGDSCEKDNFQCSQLSGATCVTNEGIKTCECNYSNEVVSNNRKKCLPMVKNLNGSCDESVQCTTENSGCFQGSCKCTYTDFVESVRSPGTCVQIVSNIGSECSEDIQCAAGIDRNSACLLGFCKCKSGNIEYDGHCYKLAEYIGDSCEAGQLQCRNLEGATCIQNECRCNYADEVVSENRRKCLPIIRALNQLCQESVQCAPDNSECFQMNGSHVCSCKPDRYIESEKRADTCVEIVGDFSSPCSEDVQCITQLGSTAKCLGEYCRCTDDSFEFQNRCLVPARLGQPCNFPEECRASGNNYSFCDQWKRCSCLPEATLYNNTCWTMKRIGDRCYNDNECKFTIAGESYCDARSGLCSCFQGFYPEFSNTICMSSANVAHTNYVLIVVAFLVHKVGFIIL